MPITHIQDAVRALLDLAGRISQWDPLICPCEVIWARPRRDESEQQPYGPDQMDVEWKKIMSSHASIFTTKGDVMAMKEVGYLQSAELVPVELFHQMQRPNSFGVMMRPGQWLSTMTQASTLSCLK